VRAAVGYAPELARFSLAVAAGWHSIPHRYYSVMLGSANDEWLP